MFYNNENAIYWRQPLGFYYFCLIISMMWIASIKKELGFSARVIPGRTQPYKGTLILWGSFDETFGMLIARVLLVELLRFSNLALFHFVLDIFPNVYLMHVHFTL